MALATAYRIRQIAPMLRAGTAWIAGRMRPDPTTADGECYVVYTVDQETWHVPVSDRPTWIRYEHHIISEEE